MPSPPSAPSLCPSLLQVMSKMGAIMAAGILDAGGRNVTVGLRSRSGHFRRTSCLALAVFTQYWYWYPLTYFLSLALQPSVAIGVNGDLAMPEFEMECSCKPSLFAYPAPVAAEKKEEVAKVPTAVLSTTAKAKERAKKKEAEKKGAGAAGDKAVDGDKMEVEEAGAEEAAAEGKEADDKAGEKKEEGPGAGDKDKAADVGPYTLRNPVRVAPAQVRHVSLKPESRWVPVKREVACVGILVLR